MSASRLPRGAPAHVFTAARSGATAGSSRSGRSDPSSATGTDADTSSRRSAASRVPLRAITAMRSQGVPRSRCSARSSRAIQAASWAAPESTATWTEDAGPTGVSAAAAGVSEPRVPAPAGTPATGSPSAGSGA